MRRLLCAFIIGCVGFTFWSARPASGQWFHPLTKGRYSIQLDDRLFLGVPDKADNISLLKQARGMARSDSLLYRTVSGAAEHGMTRLPSVLKRQRTLRFESADGDKEICIGRINRVLHPEGLFLEKEWKYVSAGSKRKTGVAISTSKGGKTIVLIDQDRGSFLSIAIQAQ